MMKRTHGHWISIEFRERGDFPLSRLGKAFIVLAIVFELVIPATGLFWNQTEASTSRRVEPALQAIPQETKAQAEVEEIVARPKNIKEKTAIYVFLVWLWISIGALIYVLRLKIKEADRIHALKFFSPDGK